ncbi:helix-turn-helix domain-containing protein [Streptomyces olivaceoviridis]|uniref:helix-turn-helix domain-containing protein n=1 Tax=Streptomyces olivaceoviridis TaxID=1921 RepID=UPI0036F7DB9E
MKKYAKGTRPRPLPPTLPEACASLIEGLRDLKDRSGLTLAELAELTAISKSSWERYLNGKQFPPRHAVEALRLAVRSSDAGILARWARAEAVWSGRDLDITAPGEVFPASAGYVSSKAALRAPGPIAEPVPRQTPGPVHALLLAASEKIGAHPVVTVIGVFLASAMMIVPAALYHTSHNTAPASTAPLPPICRLTSCAGRDPRTTACEDPKTLASYTATDGTRLELRLSPRCQAGWIRARPTHDGFRIEISSPGQRSRSNTATRRSTIEDLVTTPMIAAPQPSRLRACYYASADRSGRECFNP